jgi:hypothetical protein
VNDGGDIGTNRRRFLVAASAGLAGSAFPSLGWADTQCDSPSRRTGTADAACVPGLLPALALTSAAPSGVHPWTFGHAFRVGDLPRGSALATGGSPLQLDVRNRWPDGSAKFAVLSGESSFTRNRALSVELARSTPGVAAPNTVAEPAQLDVSLEFSGDVEGVFTLQSCVGVDRSAWLRANPGCVRRMLGPVMSEFHYYRPTSDPHVAVWFFVRSYSSGATEVETVIENGWLHLAGPGQRSYRVAVSVNGAPRFATALEHFHHTRWSRVDWLGTDPQVVPRHDAAYLRATKLVPNYGYTEPAAAAFAALASARNPEPFELGNWSAEMASTGAHPAIGLLPRWEALYCTTGDARAYAATVANQRCSGRWPIHYRDETTGRVPLYSAYPRTTLTTGWGEPPPEPTGGEAGAWDIPHHPSNGYLAYLLEGRWSSLESLQFAAFTAIAESNPDTRQRGGVLACVNAPLTTRGSAWAWRTMGQAAAISPTTLAGEAPAASDAALQGAFAASIGDTARWARQRYLDGTTDGGVHRNRIGWLGQYDRYTEAGYPESEWWGGSWMVQFQSLALGHIADLEIENLGAEADLAAIRDHSYDHCLQQLGDESTWNFRRGAVYDRPYLKESSDPSAPVFMTTTEAFSSYKTARALVSLSADPGDPLQAHSTNAAMGAGDTSNDASGFWAVTTAVLASAIDHGKPGAAAKWELVRAAVNFAPAAHGADDDPTWAIVPRV